MADLTHMAGKLLLSSQRKRATKQGFTLVELFVVIGTIAIMAGMLLPGLAKSRIKPQKIRCLDNVRQLNLAFQMYAADNGGNMVPNNDGHTDAAWAEGFLWNRTSETNLAILNDPRVSLFAPYIPVSEETNIYQCPSDDIEGTHTPGPPPPRIRSYALNSYMGWQGAPYHNQGDPTVPYRLFKRLSQITGQTKNSKQTLSPSEAFTFQDVQPSSICSPCFGMFFDHNSWYHFPATFHNESSSIGFADGHVESHRWRMPSTTPSAAMIGNPPAHLGNHDYPIFPPSQSEDLFWLQDHTTGRK
jgi:prepilin-type processing-associated H-X9-DG protein